MNLIFVLANHSAVRVCASSFNDVANITKPVGNAHFSENIDFIDLFLRKDVSSVSRGRAFLWLCYHYLEAPSADSDEDYDDEGPANPFADHRRGNSPTFVFLSEAEVAQENVDPEEEKILAEKLVAQRADKLRIQGAKESNKDKGPSKLSVAGSVAGDEEDEVVASIEETKPKGKRGSRKIKASLITKERKAAADKPRRSRLKDPIHEREPHSPVPAPQSDDEYDQYPSQSEYGLRCLNSSQSLNTYSDVVSSTRNQYPQRQHQYQPQLEPHSNSQLPYRTISSRTPEPASIHRSHRHRYSPYMRSPVTYDAHYKYPQHKSRRPRPPPAPLRSMLQRKAVIIDSITHHTHKCMFCRGLARHHNDRSAHGLR